MTEMTGNPMSAASSAAPPVQQPEPDPPKEVNQLSCLRCFKELRDRQTALIVLTAVLYFMGVAVSGIPITLLINKRIAGDAEDPNAESAFVSATNSFVHSLLSFIFGRYTSGLGDYLGRKPVLLLSAFCFFASRVVYLIAQSPAGFYLAGIVGGLFDCFYFSALAWVCDVFPEGSRRSKRVGLFTGVVGGVAFLIGLPLGAVLASALGTTFPIKVSMALSVACMLSVALLPVDDTLGVVDGDTPRITVSGRRSLPPSAWGFLRSHFPVSAGSWQTVMAAKFPADWLVNFLMHSTASLLNLIFIQYALAVYGWSGVQASGALALVGISLATMAPAVMHRYAPIPLAFRAMGSFTAGLCLLSVSGTGMDGAQFLGMAGIAFIAMGTSWVPSLQTNLLSQYCPDEQGGVSGLLSQQKDSCLIPAYIMSLGFTVSLGNDGPVYWPGSCFAAAGVLGVASVYIMWRVHGSAATTLSSRKAAGDPSDAMDAPLRADEGPEQGLAEEEGPA